MDKKNETEQKILIPHYISSYSIKYNEYILPIYLFLKQRSNRSNQIYFSYQSLLQFYENDKFSKKYEKNIISALVFLVSGTKEEVDKKRIKNSFLISNRNNKLKNIFNSITIQEDESNKQFKIVFSSNKNSYNSNNNYTLEQTIEILTKELQNSNNIILYDDTVQEKEGYILVQSNLFDFLNWYYNSQLSNENKLQKEYKVLNNNRLKEVQQEYKILTIANNTKLSIIILINLYIFIYRHCIYNKNIGKQAQLGMDTIAKTLSISKTTVNFHIKILQHIELIEISKGSFNAKKATVYKIYNKWENCLTTENDISNQIIIYHYSVVTKEQFKKILNCYTKQEQTQQIVKRGRGRPKKQ